MSPLTRRGESGDARLVRYFLPDHPLHVIERGDNRKTIFFSDEDRERYRAWLGEAAAEYGCAVHADVLMTNHVHLLVTPRRAASLPRTLQSLGRRYVRHDAAQGGGQAPQVCFGQLG